MRKPVVFKNKYRKQLIGILHLPKGNKKSPLVIICHGFGGNKTDLKLVRLAGALEKNKIAVFRFDFEGCGDSEGNFLKATLERELADLTAAFQRVIKRKDINKKKIIFLGHSFGGLICALFILKNKIKAKAIAMWAPAFNQKELMRYWTTPKQLKQWKKQGYLYRPGKERIIGLDYLNENENKDYSSLISQIKIPILIIHGSKDKKVPVKFSRKLANNHRNVKLIIVPKADHNFEDYYIQKTLINITLKWIKKCFK